MEPPATVRHPRAAMLVVYAAFGAALGALSGSMPAVARNAAVDSVSVGLGLMISTVATVVAMSLGGLIAQRVTNRRMLLLGLPAFAILLAVFLSAQAPWWFFAAFVPLGFIFGVVDLFMNAEGAAIEHDLGRPVFTMFHASVSISVAFFAVASSYVSVAVSPLVTSLMPAAMFVLSWLLVYRHVVARPLTVRTRGRSMLHAGRRPLVFLGIAAGLIIAAETSALLWSAQLLDDLAPSLAAIAGIGAAFYGLCNALLRVVGDRLRARLGDLPLMVASLAVSIAGFAALGFSQHFLVSVIAFAVVGFGTAVLIPCVFALAASYVPGNRAGGLGFVALLSGGPRVLAPWIFGWAASVIGINGAFGLLAIGLAVALLLVVILQRRN